MDSARPWWGVWLRAPLARPCAWVAGHYGPERALLALTALAASPFFVVVGHINLLDGAFCLWLTAAVLAFTQAQASALGSKAERRWMLTAWALAALAVLSKGIVVVVLAGGALPPSSLPPPVAPPL